MSAIIARIKVLMIKRSTEMKECIRERDHLECAGPPPQGRCIEVPTVEVTVVHRVVSIAAASVGMAVLYRV